jgi:hypothetical protein
MVASSVRTGRRKHGAFSSHSGRTKSETEADEEGACSVKFVAAAFARLSVPRGLWHYLIVRSELRAALETERERNRAFAAHREGMQDIAELMDYEDHEGGSCGSGSMARKTVGRRCRRPWR